MRGFAEAQKARRNAEYNSQASKYARIVEVSRIYTVFDDAEQKDFAIIFVDYLLLSMSSFLDGEAVGQTVVVNISNNRLACAT